MTPVGARAVSASVQAAVARACARGLAPLELLAEVARTVRRPVPYAVSGWLVTDPATLLGTAIYSEGVEPALQRSLIEHELTHDDVNSFAALARRRHPVASLSTAIDGNLARSSRHRRLYAPNGYGDELRAAFRTGDACWGQMCLTRRAGDPDFSPADVALLGGLTRHVANGLRTSLAVHRGAAAPIDPYPAPGVIILDHNDNLESLDERAGQWLRKLPAEGTDLPTAVYAVARQARLLAAGAATVPAAARVRTLCGDYVAVRGTCLASPVGETLRVAVVVEAPRAAELAPLILALGDLTRREQQVAQLLLRGTPTAEIAQSLWISPHTVRDHIKSVFGKLQVRSRAELGALILDRHLEALPRQ